MSFYVTSQFRILGGKYAKIMMMMMRVQDPSKTSGFDFCAGF